MNDGKGRSLVSSSEGRETLPAEKSINLGKSEILDLSTLSEAEVSELKRQYATGMINVKKKAEELKVDVGALDALLGTFTDQASKAALSGISATIQHSQTTTAGRTEVIIGNTDKAASGKLSSSALGGQDKTIWIVAIIAIAVIAVGFLISAR